MKRRCARAGLLLVIFLAACQPTLRPEEAPAAPEPVLIPARSPAPATEPPLPIAAPTATRAAQPSASPTAPTVASQPGVETLQTLLNTTVPARDLRLLAAQLQGLADIPLQVSAVPANHAVGDVVQFWVGNLDTKEQLRIDAQLRYEREHVYFFVDTRVAVDDADVAQITDVFEEQIYPTNRAFFGSEWSPGVDGDPQLYILYAQGLGSGVAGYYSSSDEYAQAAHEYSNEKEMFYINADTVALDAEFTKSVLAHEFQHMIQWANDSNEETWVLEGAAGLAEYLNGFGGARAAPAFTANPDVQLNAWAPPGGNPTPHYGAGFLFLAYFLDRFGETATQALVSNPANGLPAVDETLAELGIVDPLTGQRVSAQDVFADWVLANYLQDATVADGRFAYRNILDVPRITAPTARYAQCPTGAQSHSVNQFGADYLEIACAGEITIKFRGAPTVPLLPANAFSGNYAMWGNRQDNSIARLQHTFDLTNVESATLEYATWFALEEDYDYAYVEVSTDGGATWTILETPAGTSANPTGNNLGWGYNGFSGGAAADAGAWINERVDLSAFAGQQIDVRFDYVTDDATNRAGILIDDVAVPEIGFFDDFETGSGAWRVEGFARSDNVLPQTYLVQLIIERGGEVSIERMELDANQTGEATLTLAGGERVIVAVSGATLFTTTAAGYTLEAG